MSALENYIYHLADEKIEDWIIKLEGSQKLGELKEVTELLRLLCEELQMRDEIEKRAVALLRTSCALG